MKFGPKPGKIVRRGTRKAALVLIALCFAATAAHSRVA